MADDSYRETALKQAVLSHGKSQTTTTDRDLGIVTVIEVPNNAHLVVTAALAYERFLDRSGREAEEWADKLAEIAKGFLTHYGDEGSPAAEVLRGFEAWKTHRSEPF